MGYRLTAGEDVPDEVRRVAAERLDHAVAALRGGGDAEEAVHTARKDIKKTRSLLRLLKGDVDGDVLSRENDALRAAAATLAETRDADALAGTVDGLADRFAGRLPRGTFTALADGVRGHAPGDPAAAMASAAEALGQIRERADRWPLDGCDWDTVLAGLQRSYARGRTAGRRALADPTAEHMHEWRKRAKDLWYQLRLARPLWPALLDAEADAVSALTDVLGDDHDLTELRRRLTEGPAPVPELDDVLALLDHARELQLADARPLAARVYAERPKAHARRLARYRRALALETPEAA